MVLHESHKGQKGPAELWLEFVLEVPLELTHPVSLPLPESFLFEHLGTGS